LRPRASRSDGAVRQGVRRCRMVLTDVGPPFKRKRDVRAVQAAIRCACASNRALSAYIRAIIDANRLLAHGRGRLSHRRQDAVSSRRLHAPSTAITSGRPNLSEPPSGPYEIRAPSSSTPLSVGFRTDSAMMGWTAHRAASSCQDGARTQRARYGSPPKPALRHRGRPEGGLRSSQARLSWRAGSSACRERSR
jgi:hypothetical protein